MKEMPVIAEAYVAAPPERVWKALTDKEEMKQWYFDLAAFEPEVGFAFSFSGGPEDRQYVHLCEVKEVVRGKKLAYSWRYEGYVGDTLVSFYLIPEGDGTRVRVTHEGIETFPSDNADFARGNFEEGWNHIIGKSLPAYFEQS